MLQLQLLNAVMYLVHLITNASSLNTISLPIQRHYQAYKINSTLEYSKEIILFQFDLTSNYTLYWNWTFPSPYQQIQKPAVKIKLQSNQIITADEILNEFVLAPFDPYYSMTIRYYPYYYYRNEANINSRISSNHIGLNYHYDNYSYSIVHHFKKQGWIENLTFAFIKHSNTERYIYFGGLPDRIDNKYLTSYCSVPKSALNWECSIGDVRINHQSKQYIYKSIENSHIVFSGGSNTVYCPKEFMLFFMNEVIKLAIYSEQCYVRLLDKQHTISCAIDYVLKKGNMTFHINNNDYSFDFMYFWTCSLEYCDFNIVENIDKENEWIIGGVFIENLIVMFDYDNSLIHFYSNNNSIQKNSRIESNNKSEIALSTLVIIYILCIIVEVIGICFNSYTMSKIYNSIVKLTKMMI